MLRQELSHREFRQSSLILNGEVYENKYGLQHHRDFYGTVTENREGRGPCYLGTKGISREQEEDLYKAYLNMAPSQTLKWLETAGGPSEENVEIEGTEPYIVGGHTAVVTGLTITERLQFMGFLQRVMLQADVLRNM